MSTNIIANKTDPTLINTHHEISRSPTVMGDDMADSSKLDQLQSSQGESPSQQMLELADLYSNLAPPPTQWVDAFRMIAMLPEWHFLLRGVESAGEGNLCDQLPAILEAFTQVVTRATGAWLDVKAVWRNTNTANSLRAYSPVPNAFNGSWNESAGYCVAMQRYQFRDDAYMQPSAEPRQWFTSNVMEALKVVLTDNLTELIYWAEVNEKQGPPQRELRDTDHPLFLHMDVREGSIPDFIDMFQVPRYGYDFALLPQHDTYKLRALWMFVITQNSLVVSGGVAGGPNGVLRVILCLLVISNLMLAMEDGRLILGPTESSISQRYGDGKAIPLIIHHLTDWLKDPVQSTNRPVVFPGLLGDKWNPEYVDLEMSGLEDNIRMMWPYGLYSADLTLTGALQETQDAKQPSEEENPVIVLDSRPPSAGEPPESAMKASNSLPDPSQDLNMARVIAPTLTGGAVAITTAQPIVTLPPDQPMARTISITTTQPIVTSPPDQPKAPVPTNNQMHTELSKASGEPQPRTLVKPKVKPPPNQRQEEVISLEDSGDDVYALFKQKPRTIQASTGSSQMPATEKTCPTQLPDIRAPAHTRHSLSADSRPEMAQLEVAMGSNVLGLRSHGEGGADDTFNNPVGSSTPQSRSRSMAPRPLGLSQAGTIGTSAEASQPWQGALTSQQWILPYLTPHLDLFLPPGVTRQETTQQHPAFSVEQPVPLREAPQS
ncbi:hypothetical protein RSAG8_08178, partial [Rhizoctonia solani AG-8 WAC10335]